MMNLILWSFLVLGGWLKKNYRSSVLTLYFLYISVAPMIWIPNQLIGAAIGKDVTLECITEAMPKAISYWVYNGTMV